MDPLTTKQQNQLDGWIEEVRLHEAGMLKWAEALWNIKTSNLWKTKNESWPQFCEETFGYSRTKAYEWPMLFEFVQGQKRLAETNPETVVPETLRQAKKLRTKLSPPPSDKKKSGPVRTVVCVPVLGVESDQKHSAPNGTNMPNLPIDLACVMAALEKDFDRLIHRGDIPYDALKLLYKMGSEIKQARQLLQGVLPGFEQVVTRPVFKAPSLEEVQLYCEKTGVSGNDANWFWHHLDSSGWKNGGRPVKSWHSLLTAWKLKGYLPSQKPKLPVNSYGRYGANGQPVKSIVEQDIDRMRAQVDRL